MSEEFIAAQRAYYDERAPDYLVTTKPSDRAFRGWLPGALRIELIDSFAPTGDVLELACGSGESTQDLVRHARTLTCVDGSPRMIERNRSEVGDPRVRYVLADLFAWTPDRTYDEVYFSSWLSHVPLDRFDAFWDLVRRCLAPGGRVAFLDEDDRGGLFEPTTLKEGVSVAERTLDDGRAFDIVKVFWRPDELEERLRASGWDITVRPVGEIFLWGTGRPAD
jgi:SAM-dependent methyltransferase